MKVYVCTNSLDVEKEIKAIFKSYDDADLFKKESDYQDCNIEIEEQEVIE
jgi:hypothetical protein